MTKFTLIRHSITDWNEEGRWQGHSDTPLNAKGHQMALDFAEKFEPNDIEIIYSSDLCRAVKTAEAIALKHSKKHIQDLRIRELKLGIWEGMLIDDIRTKYSKELNMRQTDPESYAPDKGETLAQLRERILPFFEERAKESPVSHICVVSHSVVIRTMLAISRSLPLSQVMTITCEHLFPYEIEI